MAIEIEKPAVGLSKVAVSDTHGEDSPYFAGWKAYDEDPYDELSNPSGVIQMGLAENQVSFDLLEQYIEKHSEATNLGNRTSGFRDNALFQDYHGLQSFRKAMACFMEQIRGGRAKFNPDRVVITAGATAANELLTFILADPGDALLIPTPYYPGLSKDLGLPGFRVGTIYSYNDKVVTTARRMSSFTLISSQTQQLLASMLSDKTFTENYIKTNRERLKKRYQMIIDGLKNSGIECLKGNAGLFCWMNLSPLLEDPTKESELTLWKSMLHEVKLNISPGSSCHCSDPGWFRVCFANMSEQTLKVALTRIHDFMDGRKAMKTSPDFSSY
ncbi:1-aminocyclopropane-1-carboxylate synthase 7-like [Olea europaea subsp. europaea]|uniref:1-aminocyclopropane-1-carboxylate synthase 7-like n=1 Tax=Olea europaea subsp. europaea TaxID=158383 RepID=A0A8S0UFY2_OLEEU|nr:1-aminocyclopropane-1-carboxylate synthase 7-like [Olea europaea subsp. europaea]